MTDQPQPPPDTIAIGGRTFTVETVPEGDKLDPDRPYYLLHGTRGACYRTIRNEPNPDVMFIVSARGMGDPFPGVWLTDRSGRLERR
jgi:hypothetical protein